jgi:predicted phosphatase
MIYILSDIYHKDKDICIIIKHFNLKKKQKSKPIYISLINQQSMHMNNINSQTDQ